MNTQQLDALLKVIDSGSFSAAAMQLGMNTSSVTRFIQNLENEIGFTLLHRTTRKLTLTPAGQIYSEQIRQMLAGLQTAQQKALDIQQNLTGGRSEFCVSIKSQV